jgi:hypothetical protein
MPLWNPKFGSCPMVGRHGAEAPRIAEEILERLRREQAARIGAAEKSDIEAWLAIRDAAVQWLNPSKEQPPKSPNRPNDVGGGSGGLPFVALEGVADSGEGRVQPRADNGHRADDHDGNERSNETVFDGRGAIVIPKHASKSCEHDKTPRRAKTVYYYRHSGAEANRYRLHHC